MKGDEQPGLEEIEQCFIAVLDGRMSRDEADRWAARWVADDDLAWDGDGAKGPRLYDWAAGMLHWEAEPGFARWILIRRSATAPEEVAFYLTHGPIGIGVEELVGVAGARWAIEECFASAKNETGLDHYQVRRYPAWYRHITLAMLAHAFLAVTAAGAPKAQAAWSASHPPRSVVSWHT